MQIHFDLVYDKLSSTLIRNYFELPLKNDIPLVIFGDYTNQIHYTTSDHHVRWCSYNGEHQYGHHIIHMTHALPFGSCSEAMSVHARLAK